jgi:hypothetical protein
MRVLGRWKLPRPDLNDSLALIGLPVAGFALWQIAPVVFWAGLAALGIAAAAWGLYRAG